MKKNKQRPKTDSVDSVDNLDDFSDSETLDLDLRDCFKNHEFVLTVRTPFLDYKKGTRILEHDEVQSILDSSNAHMVLKTKTSEV